LATDAVDIAVQTSSAIALELLDIWRRVSSRHVSLGTSCACGLGGVTLQLQDFEQDIVDFVLGQAERNKRVDVIAYLRVNAFDPQTERGNVGLLLTNLSRAQIEGHAQPDIPTFVLERLGKTLRSFASLHG
jgi:hypothetical protein